MLWVRLVIVLLAVWRVYTDEEDKSEERDNKWKKQLLKNACRNNPDYGRCKGRQAKWFYNKQRNKCEPFIYSGCGGNHNRFHGYKECDEFCRSFHTSN
ncbi:protease inhibitor-like [Drosophila madeirensis]|uniref:Protease inhibitor-like n=1 Tax=Drosophila madeirensis TaxID=30013 RepID=A0AAU9EZQ4_DROMD